MSDISWADGVRIIEAARQSIAGRPSPADQPVTAPPPEYKSLLSDDQAQGFQLLMNILGHNGDTVGRGSNRDLLLGGTDGKHRQG